MAIRFFIPFNILTSQSYSLKIKYGQTKTHITMNSFNDVTTTEELPATISLLKKCLPNIFTSECFNDLQLSFEDEARQTEVGHLFEHILLEYLCTIKLSRGCNQAEFSGITRWNWNKNPRGMFTIEISADYKDRLIFNEALKKSTTLMNTIFEKSREQEYSVHYSHPTPVYNFAG